MNSLNRRIVFAVGLVVLTLSVISGIALYTAVRHALVKEFDDSLTHIAISLEAMIETNGRSIETEMAEKEFPLFSRVSRPDYYQVYDADGTSLEKSARMGPHSLSYDRRLTQSGTCRSVVLPDGRRGRVVSVEFSPLVDPEAVVASAEPGISTPLSLVVGRDTLDLDRTLSHIGWLIVWITMVAIAAGLLSASWAARIGLAPLNSTAKAISKVDGSNLTTAIVIPNAPAEIAPIVDQLNRLLIRIDGLIHREREFSANIAHELRTPLSGLRSAIEVALRRN